MNTHTYIHTGEGPQGGQDSYHTYMYKHTHPHTYRRRHSRRPRQLSYTHVQTYTPTYIHTGEGTQGGQDSFTVGAGHPEYFWQDRMRQICTEWYVGHNGSYGVKYDAVFGTYVCMHVCMWMHICMTCWAQRSRTWCQYLVCVCMHVCMYVNAYMYDMLGTTKSNMMSVFGMCVCVCMHVCMWMHICMTCWAQRELRRRTWCQYLVCVCVYLLCLYIFECSMCAWICA